MPHSGSTALSLFLSSHSKINSFGEVKSFIEQKKKTLEGTENFCSCGERIDQCPFWNKVKFHEGSSFLEKYNIFIENVFDSSPSDNLICDSSKDLFFLRKLNKDKIKVIFLVRDIRGWVASMMLNLENKNKGKYCLFRFFFSWLKSNFSMIKYLNKNGIDYICIYYKEFCFESEKTSEKIINFLRLKKENLSIVNSNNHHICYSNRMKLKKNNKIQYDTRWFDYFWVNFWYILFFPLINVLNKYFKKN